jgi:hypothetical protein
MRTAAFGFLLTLLAVAHADDSGKWKEHTSKEGRFVAAFPELPVEKPGMLFVAKAENRTYWMHITYDSPEIELKDKETARSYLSGGQKGTVDAAKGKLLKEREFDLRGQPARDFSFKSAKYGIVRCQLILANGRIYHLTFFAEAEKSLESKEAQRFFNSFKALK